MDNARNSLQDFVRAALQSKQCSVPPLVVHVDDYLGPQQIQLLGELSYSSAMTQIAKWYDTVGISYAEVVRDIAYLNDTDATFINKKDVHYGHWAHQTIAWSVGFASLELFSNYCDDEYYARTTSQDNTTKSGNVAAGVDSVNDITKDNTFFLPPPLTRNLSMDNATDAFTAALDAAHQSLVGLNCTYTESAEEGDKSPCIVSWIATPGGFGTVQINRFMKKYSTANEFWRTENKMDEGWSNKVGYIATEANASFTLKFEKVTKNVKTITFYFIRSYGEKWKDSRAKFTISRLKDNTDGEGVTVLSEEEISGVSADEHSLTLDQTMSLSETILKGETINIKVDLVSGSHFKIMGMMICNK